MQQNLCVNLIGVAIVIIFISNCVVCHEKSANVNRKKRLTDNGPPMQLQQNHQKLFASESNTDQTFNDRDRIVFDHDDLYDKINADHTTVSSMTISNNLPKSNETYHKYSGKPNGEYEFR